MEMLQGPDLPALTVRLLTAFAIKNMVRSGELPQLVLSVHNALEQSRTSRHDLAADPALRCLVVSAAATVSRTDVIVSLINNKPYRTLKRHLGHHGLTPDLYRHRYGLPGSYSMVAPEYSELRSRIARQTGLGKTSEKGVPV